MEIIPSLTYIAYFENKFKNKYYIIGDVTEVWSAIYPETNNKVNVCLFLIKAYAGSGGYFRNQGIPLTAEKFKKDFPENPRMILTNTPCDLRNQSEYIKKSVKKEKETFLFYVRCALSAWKKVGADIVFDPIDIHYALLPLVHKGTKPNRFEELDPCSNYSAKISEYISTHLWCDLAKEGNELIVTYKKYQDYLFNIASVIYDFHGKEKISEKDIARLNKYKPPIDNPISEFIYSFLYEFKESLKREKKLGLCPTCETTFQYKEKKIYCSRKCSKSRESAAYYQRYKSLLLPKKRQATKELRAFYRERGVKK